MGGPRVRGAGSDPAGDGRAVQHALSPRTSLEEERREWFERIAAVDRAGALRAADAVNRRPDFAAELTRVRVPTLILVGGEDRATPPAEARRLHAGVAGSRLTVVPSAGHTVTVERPEAVSE